MPKPVKKVAKKRATPPKDVNQWARHMVEESTAEHEPAAVPSIDPAALSAYMSALGRKGGKASGALRLTTIPQEKRSAIALKAARARWAKHKRPKTR